MKAPLVSSTHGLSASVLRTDLAGALGANARIDLRRGCGACTLDACTDPARRDGSCVLRTCAVLFRARRSFGQTILLAQGNGLQLGDAGEIGRREALTWTLEARARKQALAVAAVGAALAAGAFVWEALPLVVIGIPALLIGLATWGALSQRVTAS
jgi:hypothetical protein